MDDATSNHADTVTVYGLQSPAGALVQYSQRRQPRHAARPGIGLWRSLVLILVGFALALAAVAGAALATGTARAIAVTVYQHVHQAAPAAPG